MKSVRPRTCWRPSGVPGAGTKQLNAQYVGSAIDRIGYGALWGQNGWHGIWVSRLKVPNGWTYATFEEAEGGIIPSFIHVEPEEGSA